MVASLGPVKGALGELAGPVGLVAPGTLLSLDRVVPPAGVLALDGSAMEGDAAELAEFVVEPVADPDAPAVDPEAELDCDCDCDCDCDTFGELPSDPGSAVLLATPGDWRLPPESLCGSGRNRK